MKTPYIGFFRRAAAFIIDTILISIPPLIFCLPFAYWQANVWSQLPAGEAQQTVQAGLLFFLYALWQLFSVLTFWLYNALCESSAKQATLGKMLLRIKVVDEKGQRITFYAPRDVRWPECSLTSLSTSALLWRAAQSATVPCTI